MKTHTVLFTPLALWASDKPILPYVLEIKPNLSEKAVIGSEQLSVNISGEASIPLNGLVIDNASVCEKYIFGLLCRAALKICF